MARIAILRSLHVIRAAHPEIAYRIALARGAENRYGRRFLGLSHLEPDVSEIEPIGCSRWQRK